MDDNAKDMPLDRYSGQAPKYIVLRRDDGQEITNTVEQHARLHEKYDGAQYALVKPFDYFTLKLTDLHAAPALIAYAQSADQHGQKVLAEHVRRMVREAQDLEHKLPDN